VNQLRQREATERRLGFALVCGAALLAYVRSFAVPFQFDDFDQIVSNPAMQAPTLAAVFAWGRARVIPFATLVLDYQIGGEATFGYHVVSFAVHLLTTFFVFRLALALGDTPRLRGTWFAERRLALATAAALIFACHPIQVQAVTYIVQRATSVAAMFYVGSVFFYVVGRNCGLAAGRGGVAAYVTALLFALAAFLSKENTATLPFAIVLTEVVFYGGLTRRVAMRLVPFVAFVAVIPLAWALLWPHPADESLPVRLELLTHRMALAVDSAARSSPEEYFLTQCLVIPRYLWLVLFPSGFNVDHDVPVARAFSTSIAAGLALLAGLLAFGLYTVRRWPLVGFGLLWMFLTLAVESSFIPIADVMMEHRMYLPMVGVALVLGTGFAWMVTQAPRAAFVAGGVLAMALVVLTAARNEVWRSPLALWQDALAKSPGKARVHLNVGTILHQEGRLKEAIPYYCKALELEPENKLARANLTLLLDQRLDSDLEEGDANDGDEGIDLTLETANEKLKLLVPTDPCKRQ